VIPLNCDRHRDDHARGRPIAAARGLTQLGSARKYSLFIGH
jgi:hypothetical protein